MPANALMQGIGMILALVVAVMMLEFFVPLSQREMFQTECRQTLLAMEDRGELTTAEQDRLRQSLLARGFQVEQLQAEGASRRRGELRLRVTASVSRMEWLSPFQKQTTRQRMEYDKTLFIRKVINE